MLQIHFEVDVNDKRQLGALVAAFNAIASFVMHAEAPQGAVETTTAPKTRKPRGNSAGQAPQAEQSQGGALGEPGLFPHAHADAPQQQQQQQQQQPPQGAPDLKTQLHSELRNFSTVCGPMALQGLLAYFGAQRASDLPMERAEEIFGYIRQARAQMQQQQQGPGMQ